MYNPFQNTTQPDITDEKLIEEAVSGNKASLDMLLRRHQDWIYNIALRMVFNPDEAADITQEVLIKIITKLSTFRGKSRFTTWVYRIVINHILNTKRSRGENSHASDFKSYWKSIDATPDLELPDDKTLPVDSDILVEEVKISCMFGMLLCLSREQRIVYILSVIFGVSDSEASEILNISKANFRQKLSRARKDLHNFMNDKCGLIKKENPCHCVKKTKALIDCGYVNPHSLRFNSSYYHKVEDIAGKRVHDLNDYISTKCENLFTGHPFVKAPDFVVKLNRVISSDEFKKIFNLN